MRTRYFSSTIIKHNIYLINSNINTESGKVRIIDIARLANVSIGTVDRVIHNRGEVSQKTREKILTIIRELNYQPDILARTLAKKHVYKFAILLPEVNKDSSFWKGPQNGIEKALKNIDHYNILIEKFLFNQLDRKSFKIQAHNLIEYHPDAVLITPVYYEESVKLVEQCTKLNIPYAFINSNLEKFNTLSFIGQNSFQSGYLAAKLISYGLTEPANIAIINISQSLNNHKHILTRQQGFESFYKENPQFKHNLLLREITDKNENAINKVIEKLLRETNHIQGIFVTNSRVYKIARSLKQIGYQPVRLIGYDLIEENIMYLEEGIIDFLISQRPVEQGYVGVMTLFNHVILNKTVNKEQYLPIDIITKENYKYYINN